MKSLLLVVALLLFWPGTILAQTEVVEWGRAYLSFSETELDKDDEVEPLEPFTFYLIIELDAEPPQPTAVSAAEGALVFASSMFLSHIDWGETFVYDIGGGLRPGNYDFVAAWYPGVELHAGVNVLGRFTGMLLEDDEDVLIEIRRTVKCPWDTCAPLRWVAVHGTVIYRAVVDPDEFIMVNRSPVAGDTSSWGRVKALYGRD